MSSSFQEAWDALQAAGQQSTHRLSSHSGALVAVLFPSFLAVAGAGMLAIGALQQRYGLGAWIGVPLQLAQVALVARVMLMSIPQALRFRGSKRLAREAQTTEPWTVVALPRDGLPALLAQLIHHTSSTATSRRPPSAWGTNDFEMHVVAQPMVLRRGDEIVLLDPTSLVVASNAMAPHARIHLELEDQVWLRGGRREPRPAPGWWSGATQYRCDTLDALVGAEAEPIVVVAPRLSAERRPAG